MFWSIPGLQNTKMDWSYWFWRAWHWPPRSHSLVPFVCKYLKTLGESMSSKISNSGMRTNCMYNSHLLNLAASKKEAGAPKSSEFSMNFLGSQLGFLWVFVSGYDVLLNLSQVTSMLQYHTPFSFLCNSITKVTICYYFHCCPILFSIYVAHLLRWFLEV